MSGAIGDTRYRSLDHWRGFAALWVMLMHSFAPWLEVQSGAALWWVGLVIRHGALGVYVFFVISGYCITARAHHEFQVRGSMGHFLRDRLLRVYPPYWAALLLAMLFNIAGAFAHGLAIDSLGVLPDRLQLIGAGLAVEPWLDQGSYLGVAWTLAYEIGFYLIAAIGLGLVLRTRQPWHGIALAVALVGLGLCPSVASWVPLLSLWPHFALGGLVWLLIHRLESPATRLVLGAVLIGAVLLCSFWQPSRRHLALQAACTCAFLVLALRPWDRLITGYAGLRWLGWVGTFSYSLYLIHAPVVTKFRNLLGRRWAATDSHSLWIPLVGCGLAIVAAWCFYRVVEQRTEKWRQKYRRHTTAA